MLHTPSEALEARDGDSEDPGARLRAESPQELVSLLLGPAGSGSDLPRQREAAAAALGALMADAPELLYSRIMEQLAPLLDRTAHDAVRFRV